MAASLSDSPAGYGLVSRILHWGMALLIVWQFTSALLRVFAEDTAVEGFFWSTHYNVGFTIWLLFFLRGAWGLANFSRRPQHEGPPLLKKGATLGHAALYALMLIVPTLAILRAVGGTRGFSVYGIEITAPGGVENTALTAPAGFLSGVTGASFHGFLGWVLLALIVGHIAMALYHGLVRRDATLDHMTKGYSTRQVPERSPSAFRA